MADAETVLATIEASLRSIPNVSFYDGYVPSQVPATGEFIDPYVVLWSGVGDNPPEGPASGEHDSSTLILDFQVTVAAATAQVTRQVARAVADKLVNLRVGTGRVKPNPDGFQQGTPLLDPSAAPARFMLPLPWRLITN